MRKIFVGFTLAEVLITLGVIGVVAAITINNLIHEYKLKTTVNSVKTAYSLLDQALKHAINENDSVDSWCSMSESADYAQCSKVIRDNIAKHLKTVKICNHPKNKECWANMDEVSYNSGMILHNGMSVRIVANDWNNAYQQWCSIYTNNSSVSSSPHALSMGGCGRIYVDINGFKNPNKDGIDRFGFQIRRDGIVPYGFKDAHNSISFENNCVGSGNYEGTCTAWLLQNENMDYLKCPEKLGWTKAKVCKE